MKSNLPSGLNQRTFPLQLPPVTFWNLVNQGVVVDGRAGGVILGSSYEEGGITVVCQRGYDFFVHALVEGGEFLLNRDASCRHLARINAMNAGLTLHEEVTPVVPCDDLNALIFTQAEPHNKLLWVNWNQASVMRAATQKHLDELLDMNVQQNPFLRCDLDDLFPSEMGGTEDGIV